MTDGSPAGWAFDKVLQHYGKDLDPSKIPVVHRNLLLTYHAHGIICNGGFPYLFEGNFSSDPEFLLTRQAFKEINAIEACAAFSKAFAVFRKSTPPEDIERRLAIYKSHYKLIDLVDNEQTPEAIYFRAMDETMRLIDEYVRNNRRSFENLK
jgi:hypothetical protein